MEGIKTLIDKLSQYNFVTNILPGTMLCLMLKHIVGYDLFVTNEWYQMGIIFYFVGMVNNRFSSLVIELTMKKTKIVKFSNYKEFIAAEKKDSKITVLSMENNVFRSYISVCTISLIASLFKLIADNVNWIDEWKMQFLLVALLLLFMLSYRKQTSYVRERVEANN